MADDVKSGSRPALPEGIARDLLVALGWAAFVAAGIAIGLMLGALGSDVGADVEMIIIAAVIAGLGTFVVRLLMVAIRRGFGPSTGASPASRSTTPEPTPDDDVERGEGPEARPAKPSATKRSSGAEKADTQKKSTTKKASGARKSGARKSPSPKKKSTTKKASSAKKKPAPRKRPGGS